MGLLEKEEEEERMGIGAEAGGLLGASRMGSNLSVMGGSAKPLTLLSEDDDESSSPSAWIWPAIAKRNT